MNRFIAGAFFTAVSLAVLALGIYLKFFRLDGYTQTEAVITHIERDLTNDTNTVFVTYTVGSETYTGVSDVYDSSFVKGQRITVYYDPDDPTKMIGDSSKLAVFTIILGSVCLLISVMIFFYKGKIDTSQQ